MELMQDIQVISTDRCLKGILKKVQVAKKVKKVELVEMLEEVEMLVRKVIFTSFQIQRNKKIE
ncbi:Uncharacterised protein [Clostridioides difficile]|nr:Uncharacterised protein [Clostridioides difficile]